ncbi:MAG: hypothetical protein HOD37_05365 [Bacteroidetes bacterium]|jgi:hypothetical protein|nr:hypothetical protein [Bacteroidota bacterium]
MSKFLNQLRHLSTFVSQQIHPRPSLLPTSFRLSTKPRRIRWFGLLIIYHLLFIILLSCGLDIEDPTPPSPPVWVQKSLPEEWPERGIDAHETGGIFLEWEPNTEENIAVYLIFSARYYPENDSLGDYEILGTNTLESTLRFNFLHSEAAARITYYYKLKAENPAGNLSVFSDAIKYTLLPSINTETMSPNGNSDTLNHGRLLTWIYSNTTEMENYYLTVLTQNHELIIRVQISPTDYVNGQESWQIPESVVFDSNAIVKWRIDMGANYINNLETSGSESTWATFLYYRE